MKKRNSFLLVLTMLLSTSVFAQITGVGFDSRSLTAYTNGASNDSIYFYCDGALGTLTATPSGGVGPFDFTWLLYEPASNGYVPLSTENDVATSTVTGLEPGGYRVEILDNNGNNAGCFRAWIAQVLTNPSVNVNPIPPGCGTVALNGQITYGTATPYYNPPADPMIIDANTEITVCFSATHTYVSDLAFYFVGPAACGSPTILLASSPGICNGGDNINNLCFTTEAAPNFNVCGAPVPLTGTYDSFGAGNTPINWNSVYGCNAATTGWRVQIYDCVGGDVGALTGATITFTGQDGCGNPQSIIYSTPPGYSSVINDNSCTAGSASIFTVAPATTNAIPYTNGFQWTASPTINIPGATTSLTPNVNPGPQVNTTFTLSITGNGPGATCGGNASDSEERIFSVPEMPAIEPYEGVACIGSPAFNLVATPAGGTWSGPGITNATTGLFNPNFAGGAGTKTITYSFNSGGCIVSAQIQIEVQASVNSAITNNPGVLCDDATVVDLNAATAGGTWSGTGITDTANGIFDSSVSGFGSFEVTYSIPNVCNGTSTTTITVAQAGPSTINDPGEICSGNGIVTFTGNPTGGTWSGPGIVDGATGAFDPTVSGNGTFTIDYLFDPLGCITSSSIEVVVTPSANTSIIDPGVICEINGIVDLALTNEGVAGTWSGNGITDATTGLFDPTAAGGGAHTIFFTVPNVCDGELSIELIVAPDALITITDPGAQCISAPDFNLTASFPGGTWSGTGITNANVGTFSPAGAGLGSFTVTYEPNNSCLSPVSIEITVGDNVDASIVDVNPVCETAAAFQLTAAAPGGVWTGNGVSPSGLFTPSPSVVGSNTITYTITGACSASDQATIVVQASPVINFTNPGPLCINSDFEQLNATPAGGSWSGSNITSNGAFNPSAAGIGSATVTYSISGVCSVSSDYSVNVVALPAVSAGLDSEICAGATTTLVGTGATSYTWGVGVSIIGLNASVSVQPNTTTTYTVIGTDANGCINTDMVVVTVNPLPVVTASVNDNSICIGEEVTLSATGLTNYNWTSAQDIDSPSSNITTSTPEASTIYTVSGTDANGCSGSAQVSVAVTNIITNILPPNGFFNALTGGVTFGLSSNATSVDWDFGNGEELLDVPVASASTLYDEPSEYVVIVTSYLGECMTMDTVVMNVDDNVELIVPNVITINGDGKNDYYRVQGKCIKSFHMIIYNRYGEVLGEINDIDYFDAGGAAQYNVDSFDSWAPRNESNDGTYFYHYEAVDCANRKISNTGEITVLAGN